MHLETYIERQKDWSEKTFGPAPRVAGIIKHIKKELAEIEADPTAVKEWVDVIILALDGAWRSGHSSYEIMCALQDKQDENARRKWPDWRGKSEDEAIEHVREDGEA